MDEIKKEKKKEKSNMFDFSFMLAFAGYKNIYLIYTDLNKKKNQHFIAFQHTGCSFYIACVSFCF